MQSHTSGPALPAIQEAAQHYSEQARQHLAGLIDQAGPQGLPFSRWMHEALYAPCKGYYSGAPIKFGDPQAVPTAPLQGDFVTAPELSPWFGRTLARQIQPILAHLGTPTILEFGAGSGALALQLIEALLPVFPQLQYRILEVSSELIARQRERLAPYTDHVQWLDQVPAGFQGCMLANEILDAMPVSLFEWGEDGQVYQLNVVNAAPTADEPAAFRFLPVPAPANLDQAVRDRMPPLPGYRSELNLQAESWVRHLGEQLDKGVALLIDYGFPRQEYYHPQRSAGTLMCHLLHHAHSHPLVFPGIQDITAHVDFTAIADAALQADMEIYGYTTQARFLLNCGILNLLGALDPDDTASYARATGPVQKLLSEAEMGELFKVMAIGKHMDMDFLGFQQGDRRHRL